MSGQGDQIAQQAPGLGDAFPNLFGGAAQTSAPGHQDAPTPGLNFDYVPDAAPAYSPDILGKEWGDRSAAHNQAALARAQYEDYKERFVPIENELINRIGNRDVFQDNVGRAVASVDTAYDATMAEYQRGLSRYGVDPEASEVAHQQRQFGLSRAADMAEAANSARLDTRNRHMQLLAGGIAPEKKPVGG